MAHEPELLILDEPTSGLDPLVRREFLESMVDVAAGGRTVLLSSHQIGEVERVADIVAILKNGKLLAVERLDDLKSQTPERLDAAARRVVHEVNQFPSLRDALAVEQFIDRREVAGDWNAELRDRRPGGGWDRTSLALFGRWFPWEKARALRVLDLIAVAQWQSLESIDQKLATVQSGSRIVRNSWNVLRMNDRLQTRSAADLPWHLAAATPVLKLYELPDSYVLWESYRLHDMTRQAFIENLRAPPKPADQRHD
jgi:energy-coupling factor transporter ATP-binding protein EcfA2